MAAGLSQISILAELRGCGGDGEGEGEGEDGEGGYRVESKRSLARAKLRENHPVSQTGGFFLLFTKIYCKNQGKLRKHIRESCTCILGFSFPQICREWKF